MPYYEWTFTIPAETAEADPYERDLNMDSGVIVNMSVFNPSGCNRFCRCRILEEISVLWPANPLGYIATNGQEVKWAEHYVLKSPGYRLKLKAWNISANYDHDVVVRINVLPRLIATPYILIQDLVNTIKHLVGLT